MGHVNPSPFVVWKAKAEPHGAVLHRLLGVPDRWELLEGVPRAATFPDDARYPLHPDFPHHLVPTDSLVNTQMLLVASERLRALFEARPLAHVEYLPVTVVDHRGRPLKQPYCIVHPIDPPDCLDLPACDAEWSTIDPDTIQRVQRLAVDERRVDASRELFRPKGYYDVMLVRRELAKAIDAAGMTGVRWVELHDYA